MARWKDRSRSTVAAVLIALGAVLLIAGTLAFYAREEVIDRKAFADRAVTALDDDELRVVVGREIVAYLVDRGSTDLVAARPLLESVVDTVIQTQPFRRIFRAAAAETNRVFFDRDKNNALFDLGDASEIVQFALRSVSPKLANQVPKDLKPQLLTLRRREFAGATLSAADKIRTLGIVLPLLSLLFFAAGIFVSPDRRVAVLRSGVAAGAAGALLAITLVVLRARTLAGVRGEDELTDEDVRGAVGGLLDAFLGDLLVWALLLALLGLTLGAAAAALESDSLETPGERLRARLTRRPRTGWGRALRGVAALGLGLLVVLSPTFAVQLAAIVAGAYLVFFGAAELLALLGRSGQSRTEAREGRRRALVVAGAAGAVVVAALVALVLVVTRGGPDPLPGPRPAAAGTCNGSFALCELRLNEAVFAGTHNSFSAADTPGWFIANQRSTIKRQLQDGIRLFLIDAHWGVKASDGRVRTDFAAEGRSRNRVAKALPPNVLKAAERLVGRIGVGENPGKRDVYHCHTVCELGANLMTDDLEVFRAFLDENRGEVIILFVEPYVAPREIEAVFERAGLDRYVATLNRDEPLPTLGALVRRNKRVIVFAEKDADGTVPWYLDGFSFVQDTPLGAKTRAELKCDFERGDRDSPLLMLNHWADLFPPRLRANRPFQTEKFILQRAHRCARERGLPVSLIAVDHYEQGDLMQAVRALNAERIQARRRTQAAGRPG